MKKSTITLLGGALFILLILLSAMIFFRYHAEQFVKRSRDNSSVLQAEGITDTRAYNISDFDSLYFENMWDVEIYGSDNYSVEIEADKALLDIIEARKNGSTLSLTYDGYIRGLPDQSEVVKVKIGMPDIQKIEFTGMGNIELKNFELDSLEVRNSGASNIEAEDVQITNLNLIVNGAANADFEQIKVENCVLDISGAAKIGLNMTGGTLTGQVSGAASVNYRGKVSQQTVQVSGIGSLEHN